ncbi:MAG: flagellar hook-associated protein FlgK [Pedosphaera sp. Tous-C6FEB]|nr:MAG: flagellar hook-associated protein FlgK [Pedosphaera sp. Tous-C6FEB]
MLGLFGTLGLGTRSLSVQRQGIETAGHNLANVNNPAYTRQRIQVRSSNPLPTVAGPVGTGVEVTAIQQIRDALLETRIANEGSVTGYWAAQQKSLQYGQAALGQEIDRQATGAEGAAAANATGSPLGLAESMQDLFDGFHSIATNPSSVAERQVLMQKAQSLATKFNLTDERLGQLHTQLDAQLADDVTDANDLLAAIAALNDDIGNAEVSGYGVANDLRDLRQEKINALAQLVRVDTAEDATGSVSVTINGTAFVSGNQRTDTLALYDAGGGQMLLRAATSGTALALTSGSMQGTIAARDGALTTMRSDLNSLATLFITQVNAVHSAGFSLTGSTGAAFFTGTGAADLALNSALAGNPSLFQAAGVAGAAGDNQTALALGQLAQIKHASLNNQTFQQHYGQTVSALGQSLATANEQASDQSAITRLLQTQRASVSSVSLDEEMADLVKFQKAFAASAKLITTVDELLETVVNLKR